MSLILNMNQQKQLLQNIIEYIISYSFFDYYGFINITLLVHAVICGHTSRFQWSHPIDISFVFPAVSLLAFLDRPLHSFHPLVLLTHYILPQHTHSTHSFQGFWWATQACSLVLDQTLPYGRASRRLAVSFRDHACSAVHAGLLLDRSHLHISW